MFRVRDHVHIAPRGSPPAVRLAPALLTALVLLLSRGQPSFAQNWRHIWQASPNGLPLADFSAVYDAANRRVLVFGGWREESSRHVLTNQLLRGAVDASTIFQLGWSQLSTEGEPPSPRAGHSASFDRSGRRMIVFGGRSADDSYDNAIYILSVEDPDHAKWVRIASPPSFKGRTDHSAVYDEVDKTLFVFGGRTDCEILGDLWSLYLGESEARWSRLDPLVMGGPSPRYGHAAVLPSASRSMGQAMFLYGGFDGHAIRSEMWMLTLGGAASDIRWTMVQEASPVGGRYEHAISSDGPTISIVGGYTDGWRLAGTDLTWRFNSYRYRSGQSAGDSWYVDPTVGGPPAMRASASLVSVQQLEPGWLYSLLGGEAVDQAVPNDEGAWSYLSPGDPPPPPAFTPPAPTATPIRTPISMVPRQPCALTPPPPSITPSSTPTDIVTPASGTWFLPLALRLDGEDSNQSKRWEEPLADEIRRGPVPPVGHPVPPEHSASPIRNGLGKCFPARHAPGGASAPASATAARGKPRSVPS